LEDTSVDGRIILTRIFRKLDWGFNSIHLAQDRDRWLAPINAVMKFRVSCIAGNYLTS
jgi:hypothetical protein